MKTKRNLIIAMVFLACGLTSGVVLGTRPAAGDDKPKANDAAKVEVAIKKLLQERVAVCEQIFDSVRKLAESGKLQYSEVADAQLELLHAKLDLAATRDERVRLCEQAVEVEETLAKTMEKLRDSGLTTQSEVLKSKLSVLDAKVALEEARISE